MSAAFYWIGVGVVATVAIAGMGYALLWLYFNLIHERFNAIWFTKGKRRLSIASWHGTKLVRKGEQPGDMTGWPADDWPLTDRPLYLSYRFGKRRLFILAGVLEGHRHMTIEGKHP